MMHKCLHHGIINVWSSILYLLYPCAAKLLVLYWFHSVCPSVFPSHIPCLLCKSHNSGWILSILSMHNDLWPWPISSRLFSLDFAIKLVKYGTTSVRSTACTVLVRFFLFPFNAQMITSMKGCVACNDLWPWLIYSRSFSHYFAMKLLRYGTSCCIHFTSCTVLDEFFPYFGTNDHWRERECRLQWPITWTYFFKVIQAWLCNKTAKIWHILSGPLYTMCISGCIMLFVCTYSYLCLHICMCAYWWLGVKPQ